MSPMSLGLMLSLSNTGGGGGVVYPDPTQRQLVASWCSIPNLAPSGMQSGGAYTANQGRHGMYTGRGGGKDAKVHDCQYRLIPGNGAVTDGPAGPTTWRRALEVGAQTYVATYDGGAATKDLVSGGDIETDIITDIPADSQVFARFVRNVATPATDTLNGINMNAPANQGFRTIGGNQIANNGAMNNSGSGGGPSVWPKLVTGIPVIPMSAYKVFGHSIVQYLNDTNTSTTGGYHKRAYNDPAGEKFVWQFCAVDANKLQLHTPTAAPKEWADLPYFTSGIIDLFTNDIAAGRSLTAIQDDYVACAQEFKTTIGPYGLPILSIAVCCLNRGTFTGAQNTIKNDLNNWLLGGADGHCDLPIDLRLYQGDTSLYSDDVHPRTADHINMTSPYRTALLPTLNPYWRPAGYVSFV